MLDKAFIINFCQVLKNGNSGSFMDFLFKGEVDLNNNQVFVYHGFKILDIDEKFIHTKIIVEQYEQEPIILTEEEIKNEVPPFKVKSIGSQELDYSFNVSKMVSIANNKNLAKNYVEYAFVDLFLNLYVKKILAKNYYQKDSLGKQRELFFIDKKLDAQALVIKPFDESKPLFGNLLGEENEKTC